MGGRVKTSLGLEVERARIFRVLGWFGLGKSGFGPARGLGHIVLTKNSQSEALLKFYDKILRLLKSLDFYCLSCNKLCFM